MTQEELDLAIVMESSDEEEGHTFVQVIREKYNPDNFPFCTGSSRHRGGIVVVSSPQGSPIKDRLNLPSILVVTGCGITKAGDEEEVATFCAHVVELDLSHNQLQDWGEIGTIVSNVPKLDFLNLSMNPLSGVELEPSRAELFAKIRRLVLINTHVTWDTVNTLTQETPELEELFLCLNEYNSVTEAPQPCSSLRLLQITDNQLQEWAEVRKFGLMYPCLNTLVLANNTLNSVQEPQDSLHKLFPNLDSINLNNSGLSQWEDIERLSFFPKLKEVKLMGIPLLQSYTNAERRSLVVARLPSVCVLNGSVVTAGEREDAERFFIRHYQDTPEEELPQRYHTLVSKYGRLAPLVEVDLRPPNALVAVRWGECAETLTLRLEQTVAELKKELKALVQMPVSGMRLFLLRPEGDDQGEELTSRARALHSYCIRDGDQILVLPKAVRPRTRNSTSTSSES